VKKPLLIVVTGRPASGKTSLAHLLAKEIKCPLLSRDEFKEGYINTMRLHHYQLNEKVNQNIYETFFQAIDLLISKNISTIVEAAFQHKLWEPKLINLLNKAEIRIIVCKIPLQLARERFYNRISYQPEREKFHGDATNKDTVLLTEKYETIHIAAPTLEVDTSNNYKPEIEKIIDFIKCDN
jgi:dephospho-CoA kinase